MKMELLTPTVVMVSVATCDKFVGVMLFCLTSLYFLEQGGETKSPLSLMIEQCKPRGFTQRVCPKA